MEASTKKELAVTFLQDLAHMSPDRLREIISEFVGEDLAAVMFKLLE